LHTTAVALLMQKLNYIGVGCWLIDHSASCVSHRVMAGLLTEQHPACECRYELLSMFYLLCIISCTACWLLIGVLPTEPAGI
jgi:hypothetical protein